MIALLKKILFDRQPSPLYVPVVVTIALLATVIGLAATVWNIAEQRARWAIEDDRNGPRLRITISTVAKPDRFRFAQLTFVNTLPHDYVQLTRIEAVAPSDLLIAEVTNVARWTLRSEPRRSLDIANAHIPPNATYTMMIALRTDRTPDSDQGQETELAADAIELFPTGRKFRRSLRHPIPTEASLY